MEYKRIKYVCAVEKYENMNQVKQRLKTQKWGGGGKKGVKQKKKIQNLKKKRYIYNLIYEMIFSIIIWIMHTSLQSLYL